MTRVRTRLQRWRRGRLASGLIVCAAIGCNLGTEGIPPGKLAVVGEVVFGPEDVAGTKAQLGAYAQLRFSGGEGKASLLSALVAAEVLAQEAVRQELGDDPRVRWAIVEEVATVYLSAELERRVPRAEVAADEAALRAYYDAHPEEFTKPQRRSMQGVAFTRFGEAEDALDELRLGAVELAGLGEVVATELQARNDVDHAAFHPFLFDPAIGAGELLTAPVMVGPAILVGRLQQIEPPRLEPFDDDAVQERLVAAVRAPRLAEARAALMGELAERYPTRDP